MNESYPILKQYQDNWVARTMFGNFLRNKRAYFKSRGLLWGEYQSTVESYRSESGVRRSNVTVQVMMGEAFIYTGECNGSAKVDVH